MKPGVSIRRIIHLVSIKCLKDFCQCKNGNNILELAIPKHLKISYKMFPIIRLSGHQLNIQPFQTIYMNIPNTTNVENKPISRTLRYISTSLLLCVAILIGACRHLRSQVTTVFATARRHSR